MATADSPSVVIVLLDALRADCAPGADESPHLRTLGLTRPHLPALSALVQGSFHFTQAMSCSCVTPPCVGSIFTGLLPPEHGLRAFDVTSLSSEVRTLAEILAADGYATCAMTDQPPVLQPMGLLRGFQTVVPNEDEALAWWDALASSPRFLFLHLWDAHKPYNMPFAPRYRSSYAAIVREWQERLRQRGIAEPASDEFLDEDEQRQRVYRMQFAWEGALGFRAGLETYLAGLETFDRGRLGDLVAAMHKRHMREQAITVVLADHGEGRDRPPSQRMTHDVSLADDIMHIPLYIRLPGDDEPCRVAEQVSEADVTPTILELCGLADERTAPLCAYSGRSLVPLMDGETLPPRPAYAEVSRSNNDPTRAIALSAGERFAVVHARALRYPDCKHRLVGQHYVMDDEILLREPAHALALVCGHLLGRIETARDREVLLPLLTSRTLSKEQKWTALWDAVYQTDEWRLLDKYAIYDLVADPLEVRPIVPHTRKRPFTEYKEKIKIMGVIDCARREGGPLLTSMADQEVIVKRLQDLGYLE